MILCGSARDRYQIKHLGSHKGLSVDLASILNRISAISRAPHLRAMSNVPQKPFLLYTTLTPNGKQVSVLLEELKAAYGFDYE